MIKNKIIAIANQKGGVGKTTTTINLAAGLSSYNKKILVIDVDGQSNLTTGFGIKKENIKLSTFDIFTNNVSFEEIIMKNIDKNIDLAPASIDLASVDLLLSDPTLKNNFLLELEKIKKNYDYVLIDCPPSLGIILRNTIASCDSVLIPVQAEFYALDGLVQLLSTISLIKRLYNSKLKIEGILITMFNKSANLSYDIAKEVRNYFQNKVYNTVICRNVKISESQSYGVPVIKFSNKCTGSKNYLDLTKEFLKQNEK